MAWYNSPMLKILIFPDKGLRKKAKKVTEITPEIQSFAKQLKNKLAPQKGGALGVGLAATQVGNLNRIFVLLMPASTAGGPNRRYEIVVNPEIVKASKKTLSSLPEDQQFLEGCLSIPGYYAFVDRPIKIKARYQTIKGLNKVVTFTSPYATYFQHELDHLNGVLFIDYLKKGGEQLYLADKKGKLKPTGTVLVG
jgi:peptide deformylase